MIDIFSGIVLFLLVGVARMPGAGFQLDLFASAFGSPWCVLR